MSRSKMNAFRFKSGYLALCRRIGFGASLVATIASAIAAPAGSDPFLDWIGRPWEYRYILQIESPDSHSGWTRVEAHSFEEKQAKVLPHRLELVLPLSNVITVNPDASLEEDKDIGVMIATFNEQGELTSESLWPHKLVGRINRLLYVVLTEDTPNPPKLFDLGIWFTGRSSFDMPYTPAVCSSWDDSGRYKRGYVARHTDSEGNFGCREWAYALKNPDLPYIDITSYSKDKGGYAHESTFIRPVTGWSYFDSPRKPIIGKHGSTWVCLYECPDGEVPGIIPDIKVWAKAHGWPVPKRPKKQPMFPDQKFNPGELID